MVAVPDKTHTYKIDPKTDKYTIGFAPELVSIIQSGEKVLTYRYGNEKDYLVVGDEVRVIDSANDIYW